MGTVNRESIDLSEYPWNNYARVLPVPPSDKTLLLAHAQGIGNKIMDMFVSMVSNFLWSALAVF